jgi:hypothetical protein
LQLVAQLAHPAQHAAQHARNNCERDGGPSWVHGGPPWLHGHCNQDGEGADQDGEPNGGPGQQVASHQFPCHSVPVVLRATVELLHKESDCVVASLTDSIWGQRGSAWILAAEHVAQALEFDSLLLAESATGFVPCRIP